MHQVFCWKRKFHSAPGVFLRSTCEVVIVVLYFPVLFFVVVFAVIMSLLGEEAFSIALYSHAFIWPLTHGSSSSTVPVTPLHSWSFYPGLPFFCGTRLKILLHVQPTEHRMDLLGGNEAILDNCNYLCVTFYENCDHWIICHYWPNYPCPDSREWMYKSYNVWHFLHLWL